MRHIIFDQEKCVGCQICRLVCSGVWSKAFNPLNANIQKKINEKTVRS
ncbi:MAG: hypothetical protein JRI95_14795 [Deltaproteobacteria bacterium]|nr:hypothetical protein [Deltaproteobacteria bacterium]MBW2086720.1 hypothetical protein [Deltaproteobacteria bacterium]